MAEPHANMVIDSMHMNLSTDSLKRFLPELSGSESQKEYKLVTGITKEALNELERQQSSRRTNRHGSEIMRYLQDANASEAFAVGGDESMAASNKEIAMKENLEDWEIQFEELSMKKGHNRQEGRVQDDPASCQAKVE